MAHAVKRDGSFDALRGIAILSVVAIHSIILPDKITGNGLNAASFWLTVFFRQMLNFAVPAFLFISGYFCARPEVASTGGVFHFLKKRVPRVLIPYLVWSLIILIGFPLLKNSRIPWDGIPYKLLTAGASGPYYFVLLIIQFYVITPLLVRIMKSGWRCGVLVLIINSFALGCFYLAGFVFHITIPFELHALPAYSWFIFYYCGLLVGQNQEIESWLAAGLKGWIALAVLFFFISCIEALIIIKATGDIAFAMSAIKFSSFAFSLSIIAVFFGLKQKGKGFSRILMVIGDYSFGIYLIHMIILSCLIRLTNKSETFSSQPLLPAMLFVVTTVSVCMCIAYGARKILGRKISARVFGL